MFDTWIWAEIIKKEKKLTNNLETLDENTLIFRNSHDNRILKDFLFEFRMLFKSVNVTFLNIIFCGFFAFAIVFAFSQCKWTVKFKK